MADVRREGKNRTAIIGIAILLIVVVGFVIFFWTGDDVEEPVGGPDIEMQEEAPLENDEAGNEGGVRQ